MRHSNFLFMGSVMLILLAIGLVAVLGKTSPTSSNTDVRARAATAYTLKFIGVVTAVNEDKGTIEISNLQFADENRTGPAKDLGYWIVTAPSGFNFASVSPGTLVTIGVDAKTFQVTKHEVTAITLTPVAAK